MKNYGLYKTLYSSPIPSEQQSHKGYYKISTKTDIKKKTQRSREKKNFFSVSHSQGMPEHSKITGLLVLSLRPVSLNHPGFYKSSVEEKVLGSKDRRNRVRHWKQGVFIFVLFASLPHANLPFETLSLSSTVSEKSPPRNMYLRFLFQFPPQHFIMPQRHQCNIQFNSVSQSCLTLWPHGL